MLDSVTPYTLSRFETIVKFSISGFTSCRGVVVKAPACHAAGSGFDSRMRHRFDVRKGIRSVKVLHAPTKPLFDEGTVRAQKWEMETLKAIPIARAKYLKIAQMAMEASFFA